MVGREAFLAHIAYCLHGIILLMPSFDYGMTRSLISFVFYVGEIKLLGACIKVSCADTAMCIPEDS